jgi:succinoglycan biosynthesis transport protein ExoP
MAQTDPRPPLASVPRVSFAEGGAVSARVSDPALAAVLAPEGDAYEKCRLLRAKVKSLGEQRPLACLGVVSATRGEGTATVALGLAHTLVREGHRALVVEAGLREPMLERALGIAAASGLGEWLASPAEHRVPLRRLDPCGVWLLTAGHPVGAPGDLLGSPAMASLLAAARAAFDYVLVDCPPLQPTADSVVLQDLLDGFLLVVRARHAARAAIRAAAANTKPEMIRGLVFTDRADVLPAWLRRGRAR